MKNRIPKLLNWLPVLILSPFPLLFLFTAFSRLNMPLELEWNEGQNAMQALRFTLGEPLYPAAEAGWVPYIYSPLYHQLVGFLFHLTDTMSLSLGRLVSLLFCLLTVCLIFEFILHHTKSLPAALTGAFCYSAYFEPSGFFYDLVRNDSMTWGLAFLGVSCLCRNEVSRWQLIVGLGALLLGTLTKQPVFPLMIFMMCWVVWKKVPGAKIAVFITLLIFVNALILYPRFGNEWFWKYVVTNAMNHANDSSVWKPTTVPWGGQAENWREYFTAPPRVWTVGFQPVIWLLPVLGLGGWMLGLKRKFWTLFLAVSLVSFSTWASIGAYAKFGGYNNNWIPLFLAVSVGIGLVWGMVSRDKATTRRNAKSRLLFRVGFSLLLLAQVIPFLYSPKDQIPTEEDLAAHAELRSFLLNEAEAGRSVWVLHHQWYGVMTGHPYSYNVDMVRCATYAGDGPPLAFYEVIKEQQFDWVIMNSEDLEYEWLPVGSMELFAENYQIVGDVLPLAYPSDAMMPVTGAPTRPRVLYEKTSFSSLSN